MLHALCRDSPYITACHCDRYTIIGAAAVHPLTRLTTPRLSSAAGDRQVKSLLSRSAFCRLPSLYQLQLAKMLPDADGPSGSDGTMK